MDRHQTAIDADVGDIHHFSPHFHQHAEDLEDYREDWVWKGRVYSSLFFFEKVKNRGYGFDRVTKRKGPTSVFRRHFLDKMLSQGRVQYSVYLYSLRQSFLCIGGWINRGLDQKVLRFLKYPQGILARRVLEIPCLVISRL